MATCFVMQPFDGGPFDKRFDDVLKPAIESAKFEPYRVDRDPAVDIPIDEIEAGIRNAAVCIADITLDNPNVWFELGYAIASSKEVVLICSKERITRFPFDVQHRTIIQYKTEAPRDFDDLKDKIRARLISIGEKIERLDKLQKHSGIAPVAGLGQHELAVLVAIGANVDTPLDAVYVHTVRQDVERSGYTPIAITLALDSLKRQGFVQATREADGYNEYYVYSLTETGLDWLARNQSRLVLRDNAVDTHKHDDDETDPFADE